MFLVEIALEKGFFIFLENRVVWAGQKMEGLLLSS